MPSSERSRGPYPQIKLIRPWMKFVVAQLKREDQPKKILIARALAHVPPGRALRRWESSYPTPTKNLTEDRKIRSGARILVAGSIHSKEQRGLLETYTKEGVKYLRLTERGRKQYADQD